MRQAHKILYFMFLLLIAVVIHSCKISYTFTGASIPPEAKTVSIQYFQNQAPLVQAQLSQLFTDALKDRFSNQTSLELINGDGDLNFEGYISGYEMKPVSIQQDAASENRLTITIKVKYINNYDPKQNFDTSFTAYEDYPSSNNLSDVEGELMEVIIEKLIDDIFNKSVANW